MYTIGVKKKLTDSGVRRLVSAPPEKLHYAEQSVSRANFGSKFLTTVCPRMYGEGGPRRKGYRGGIGSPYTGFNFLVLTLSPGFAIQKHHEQTA